VLRVLAALAFATTLALPTEDDRGRPVVILVHGRAMLDRDTAATRKMWLNALTAGGKSITALPLLRDRDVRVVWYADVLDPRSSAGCDYASSDARARRNATIDPDLKALVATVGSLFDMITSVVADTESISHLRALSADASFLGDSRKRCASEQRVGDAIDAARRDGRPVILVAHSLGSLVAYDYLSARSDTGLVQRFITVGSIVGATELRLDSPQTLRYRDGSPSGIAVEAFAVAAGPPRFSQRHDIGHTVGMMLRDEESGRLCAFVPACGELTPSLLERFARADVLLFDGTFWKDDELIALGIGDRTARDMDHLPISGPGGSLAQLATLPCRHRIYTHINNTNPMLVERSPEHALVERAGLTIGVDGMEIEV